MNSTPRTQPNILLIHSDQHRHDCLGCSGHALVRTPHLDQLAAQGVLFQNAYTPVPVCVPSRTSLLHGCWPSSHGCVVNDGLGIPNPDTRHQPCFSAELRKADYRLGHVGKWQHSAGTPPSVFGFDESVDRRGYRAWRQSRGHAPRPRSNGWFGETDPHITAGESRLAWEAGQVLDMIGRLSSSKRPFFIRWDPSEPHLPNVVPEPFASFYAAEDIEPWQSFCDDLKGKPYIQAQQRRTWKIDRFTWEDWAPVVARYLGEISLLDAQVGRLLRALRESGLSRNTLIVYTSDHGDLCGSHGMIDKHCVMYDDVVRVPLIVSWPEGMERPGRESSDFVIHALDLAATFCDVAGLAVPDSFQGVSLLPVLRGDEDGTARSDVFSVYYGNQFGLYTQRMVRDHRWKYVWNATAEDELYDIEADPGERRNLALESDAEAQLVRLRERLVAWMERTGDQQLNSWTREQLLSGSSR